MIPIIFVHGVRASSRVWSKQEETFSALGHQVLLVDLPGHGSRMKETFTLNSALGAIEEVVSTCTSPPVLVGMSLGGYSSLAYASGNSTKISGVFLSGCSTEIKGKPIRLYRSLSSTVASLLRRSESWNVVADMLKALEGHSGAAYLHNIKAPVWMVNGSHDFLRLGERTYRNHHQVARISTITGAGHDVNIDAPERFNEELLSFIKTL